MDFHLTNLEEAVFIRRENRFRAEIEAAEKRFKAHVPNSGRMTELLIKGAKIWVKKAEKTGRKTPYDLVLVEKAGVKVCLNAHLANEIFATWLQQGNLEEFKDIREWQREKTFGKSRIDFLLKNLKSTYLIEVKSVNLVVNRQARFPDAPTQRGTKHLEELANYVQLGHKAAVVFIIMRDDAHSFTPHDIMDPLFGNTLRKVKNMGVEIYAYKCQVTEKGINYGGKVPIIL